MASLTAAYDAATADTAVTMAATMDPAERERAAAAEAFALGELRAGDPEAFAALDAEMAEAEGRPVAGPEPMVWHGPAQAIAVQAYLAVPDAELELEAG